MHVEVEAVVGVPNIHAQQLLSLRHLLYHLADDHLLEWKQLWRVFFQVQLLLDLEDKLLNLTVAEVEACPKLLCLQPQKG